MTIYLKRVKIENVDLCDDWCKKCFYWNKFCDHTNCNSPYNHYYIQVEKPKDKE